MCINKKRNKDIFSFSVKHCMISLSLRALFKFNRGFQNCQSTFLKISHYGRSRQRVGLFQSFHESIQYKNRYIHFHKIYDNQIWHVVTFREVNSNETNQAGTCYGITSRSLDKLNIYLHQNIYRRMVTYLDGLLPIKSHNPLTRTSCKIT